MDSSNYHNFALFELSEEEKAGLNFAAEIQLECSRLFMAQKNAFLEQISSTSSLNESEAILIDKLGEEPSNTLLELEGIINEFEHPNLHKAFQEFKNPSLDSLKRQSNIPAEILTMLSTNLELEFEEIEARYMDLQDAFRTVIQKADFIVEIYNFGIIKEKSLGIVPKETPDICYFLHFAKGIDKTSRTSEDSVREADESRILRQRKSIVYSNIIEAITLFEHYFPFLPNPSLIKNLPAIFGSKTNGDMLAFLATKSIQDNNQAPLVSGFINIEIDKEEEFKLLFINLNVLLNLAKSKYQKYAKSRIGKMNEP